MAPALRKPHHLILFPWHRNRHREILISGWPFCVLDWFGFLTGIGRIPAVLPIAFVFCFCSAIAQEKQDPQDDNEVVQGTWKVSQMVEGGKELPASQIKSLRLLINEKELVFRDGDEVLEKGTFVLNPKTNPREWTTTPAETGESDSPKDPNKKQESKPIRAIYKLKEKQLILCIPEPGAPRPKEFVSREKSALILIVLEKQEK